MISLFLLSLILLFAHKIAHDLIITEIRWLCEERSRGQQDYTEGLHRTEKI